MNGTTTTYMVATAIGQMAATILAGDRTGAFTVDKAVNTAIEIWDKVHDRAPSHRKTVKK
jgi:hypothetical protein